MLVTGSPRWWVTSSGGRSAVWCTRIPGRERGPLLATMTSTAPSARRTPRTAAAEPWLTAASGPTASTAAMQRASGDSSGPTR